MFCVQQDLVYNFPVTLCFIIKNKRKLRQRGPRFLSVRIFKRVNYVNKIFADC